MIRYNFYSQEQVAMLHPGRCGSTVLAFMLRDHSKICWDNELFEPYMEEKKKKDKNSFVKRTIKRRLLQNNAMIYGFETKYLPQQHLSHQCINMDLEDYLKLLRKLNFSKFIVLHRKNYLRAAISNQVGLQKKEWHSMKPVTSPEKVVLEESFWEMFRIRDENLIRLKELLKHDDTLYLTYENHIMEDPRIAYKKTCDFIGVEAESPVIRFHRTNPFRYEDMVINFDEVKAALLNTEYSWMLAD